MNEAAERLENLVALAKERRREQLIAELAAIDAPATPLARQSETLGSEWLEGTLAMLARMTPASAEEVAKDREHRRIRPRISAAGVRDEHLRCIAASAHPKQRYALDTIRRMIAAHKGSIVVLFGPRGTGKTQMAAQIVRDFAERTVREEDDYAYSAAKTPREYICAYLTAARLFGRMKELYSNVGTIHADERQAEMDSMARLDLVIVDELQESADASEKRLGFGKILTALCDARYSGQKPTLLISNHYDPAKPKDLSLISAFLGDSITSRANQYGGFIVADWPSFRRQTT